MPFERDLSSQPTPPNLLSIGHATVSDFATIRSESPYIIDDFVNPVKESRPELRVEVMVPSLKGIMPSSLVQKLGELIAACLS